MALLPIVKWAGGKRQILDKILSAMPKNFNTYFEPFIGGGAVFFAVQPKNAVINDVNRELIAIYKCLQDVELCAMMTKELDIHEKNHTKEYYYEVRAWDQNPRYEIEPLWKRAARTIYLNKACFNGLYRVNAKGFFNVPIGKKEKVKTYDKNNIQFVQEYMSKHSVLVLNDDFVEACRTAKEGDFVYFDPPYDSWENKDSFTSYSKFDFTKEDQKRLAECFKDLTSRGVKCLLSNHNTKFIQELYAEFKIQVIPAKRIINSKATERGYVEEVLISNY